MKNETMILSILLIVLITAFISYLFIKKDKHSKSLRDSLEKQNDLLQKQLDKPNKEREPDPVYIPVIYGANIGKRWHRPYWGRRRL